LIKSKEKQLKSIDKDLINNINALIKNSNTNTNDQIEEYKKLLISKDNEISKLNDLNLSKENEINKLNKLIEDLKAGTAAQEMEENFKKEKEKLMSKINSLELKMYNINENKNDKTDSKENEKKEENPDENNDGGKKKKKKKNKKEGKVEENANSNNNNENISNNDKENKFKINYEELLKMKEDLEEQNNKLINEIKSLKLDENNTENNADKEEIKNLKKIIEDYKTGRIASKTAKNPSRNNSEMEELKKKFETINIKNRNYESKIKSLNDNISSSNKNKKELENIILKQEDKISELNSLLKKKDNVIHSRELAISKNESYSLQLMNMIKELKIQIQNLKKQKNDEDISHLSELKRQMKNLENTIELKENIISDMKKNHKNLQDKYLKLCINTKTKEQDNLLNNAKLLKFQKLKRDTLNTQRKNRLIISNNNKFSQMTEESNLSDVEYPNLNIIQNTLTVEKNKKNIESNNVTLPKISTNHSVKNEDNYYEYIDNLVDGEEDNKKLEEINDMMKKVIDEE
jgi:hypothetical protein